MNTRRFLQPLSMIIRPFLENFGSLLWRNRSIWKTDEFFWLLNKTQEPSAPHNSSAFRSPRIFGDFAPSPD